MELAINEPFPPVCSDEIDDGLRTRPSVGFFDGANGVLRGDQVGAVVLGRSTYEQALEFGPWPYAGRRGIVVTGRPISALPPGVIAVPLDGLASALAEVRDVVEGDVWVVGGGRTARAVLDTRLLDELELYIVPRLLGDGIPFIERRPSFAELRFLGSRSFSNGVTMVRYGVPPTTSSSISRAL